MIAKLTIIVIALLVTTSAWAGGFTWVDETGTVRTSDSAEVAKAPEPLVDPGKVHAARRLAESDSLVVIYTASLCPLCTYARSYLTRRGIDFAEVDVESSEDLYQWFRSLGGVSYPVVLAGGELLHGFDPVEFESAYSAASP